MYWPSDPKKLPNLLDFFLSQGVAHMNLQISFILYNYTVDAANKDKIMKNEILLLHTNTHYKEELTTNLVNFLL